MARIFTPGLDRPGKDETRTTYGITEERPKTIGHWVNRIVVHGDPRLRDRIVELLKKHGID